MGMEKLVSIGERLEKLLAEAEKQAKLEVLQAEKRAEEMISQAKTEADRRRVMAQRGVGIDALLREANEKAKQDAEKIIEEYEARSEALKNVSKDKMMKGIAFVLEEVIPK